MGMKEYVLWGGGLLVVLVVAHGLWQAWRSRRRRNAARADIEPDADSGGAAQMDIFEPPVLSDVDDTVDAQASADAAAAADPAAAEGSAAGDDAPAGSDDEPSAGEREGLAPRMREPSAGEREGPAPRAEAPLEAGADPDYRDVEHRLPSTPELSRTRSRLWPTPPPVTVGGRAAQVGR